MQFAWTEQEISIVIDRTKQRWVEYFGELLNEGSGIFCENPERVQSQRQK